MSSKEIPFISPLTTAAENISKSQAKFSDILCPFDPLPRSLIHLYYAKNAPK